AASVRERCAFAKLLTQVLDAAGQLLVGSRLPRPILAVARLFGLVRPLLLHPDIELVKYDVGKHRADDATLWCAAVRVVAFSTFHEPGLQKAADEVDKPFIFNPLPQQVQDDVVRDTVETGLDVAFDDPACPRFVGVCRVPQRRDGAAFRTKAMRGWAEQWLIERFEYPPCRFLYRAVTQGRDTQRTFLRTAFLLDVRALYRFRLIHATGEFLTELTQNIRVHLVAGHPVNTRCATAFVFFDVHPCTVQHVHPAHQSVEFAEPFVTVSGCQFTHMFKFVGYSTHKV